MYRGGTIFTLGFLNISRQTIAFLELMMKDSIRNPVFAPLVKSEEGISTMREGWEKLTMTKLHDLYFGAKRTDGKYLFS